MRRRQLDKLLVSLTQKIVIEARFPEAGMLSTRPEREVFRRNRELVRDVVAETFKQLRAAKA